MPEPIIEPCNETYDIGPFRFECVGHYPHSKRSARLYHDGLLEHRSASPRMVGDAELVWWTNVAEERL